MLGQFTSEFKDYSVPCLDLGMCNCSCMLAGKQDFTKNLQVKWGIIHKVIQQLSS